MNSFDKNVLVKAFCKMSTLKIDFLNMNNFIFSMSLRFRGHYLKIFLLLTFKPSISTLLDRGRRKTGWARANNLILFESVVSISISTTLNKDVFCWFYPPRLLFSFRIISLLWEPCKFLNWVLWSEVSWTEENNTTNMYKR